MRRLLPIDPQVWDAAAALSARTGIPVRLHYDTLAEITYLPSALERIVWRLRASPWRLLTAVGLVLAGIFALSRLH